MCILKTTQKSPLVNFYSKNAPLEANVFQHTKMDHLPCKEDAKVIDKNQLSSSCPTYQIPFRKTSVPKSKTQTQPFARPHRSHSYQLPNFLEGKRNQDFLFNINFGTTCLHLLNSPGLHTDWPGWMLGWRCWNPIPSLEIHRASWCSKEFS